MKIPKNKITGNLRNIKLSPLFKKGIRYNIDSKSENYQKEDVKGTLCPSHNHCWLSWEQEYVDDYYEEKGWISHAEYYHTLEEAENDKKELIK